MNSSCSKFYLRNIVKSALMEDIGKGDLTAEFFIPENRIARAAIILKENAVLAGLPLVKEVFACLDRRIKVKTLYNDGDFAGKNEEIAVISGKARAISSGERTALNFLSHLSGIATLAKKFVDKVKPYPVTILDTRKTIPGLRVLEKYAVGCGGAKNHRMGLWDGVLIKDNHLMISPLQENYGRIIKEIRKKVSPHCKIEIEVKNLAELKFALKAGADIVMLDNMAPDQIKKAVRMRDVINKRLPLEASGGVDLSNAARTARLGVEYISVGKITNSAKAVDFSLEFLP